MTEYYINFLRFLPRADFMQLMLLSTLIFLMPLNKRKGWGLRFLAAAVAALVLSVALTMAAVTYGWTLWVSALYYPAPLIASVLLFLLCSEGTVQDAIYGMGCAYAVQHMAFCAVTILWGEQYVSSGDSLQLLGSWLVQGLVLTVCWLIFAQRLPIDGAYAASWQKALVHTGVVVFAAMILNRVVRRVWALADPTTYTVCLIYDLFSCFFILLFQLSQRRELRFQTMMETERCLRLQAQGQYDLSRENIDIINRKCHDLKHQVAALRLMSDPQERENSLREIENLVMIYDTAAHTGNEVLDTVLTEKGLLCEESKISWTYLADGTLLDFMSPVDLYIIWEMPWTTPLRAAG